MNVQPAKHLLFFVCVIFLSACQSINDQTIDLLPPTNILANAVSYHQIDLSWEAPDTSETLSHYLIYRNDAIIAETSQNVYQDVGLSAATQYHYQLVSVTTSRYQSDKSLPVVASTLAYDAQPRQLSGEVQTDNQIFLQWLAPDSDDEVVAYLIYRNTSLITEVTETQFSDNDINPSADYQYYVVAINSQRDHSQASNTISINTTPVVVPLDPPSDLQAQVVSANQINLSWSAAQNSVDVLGYQLFRDRQLITTTALLTYSDTELQADTSYSYQVRAYNNARESVFSNAISAKTEVAQITPVDPLLPSVDCNANNFSFALFSDNYSGQEGGMRRVLSEIVEQDPNVHFLTSAGDTPTFERVRGLIDSRLTQKHPCGLESFPWFPATGNHDAESASNMQWWADNWATNWSADPAQSKLAQQLPGLRNFKRGPLQIDGEAASEAVDPGTIYSFDYHEVHFVFVDNYAQNLSGDSSAGVWDRNGAEVFDPTTSQLDWLQQDLETTTQKTIFAFGHVALLAPCYNYDPPSSYYDCPAPPPPGWSEHNSNFHTQELTQLLAKHNVIAYFHGHDHVRSRMLLNQNREALYQRKYWEVANDVNGAEGTPADWENLQGQGTLWQADAGRIYTPSGSYLIVSIDSNFATFKMYSYDSNTAGSTTLWDTWSVPLVNADHYVDQNLTAASCDTYDIKNRACGAGNNKAYQTLTAAASNVQPGESVLIRQSTWNTPFAPTASGEQALPIRFKNFPGENVSFSVTTGGLRPALELSNVNYLVLDGFNVDNAAMWAQLYNAHDNVIRNSHFRAARDTGTRGGFKMVDSNRNHLFNNIFEDGNDNVMLEHADKNLLENNHFLNARHTLLVLACSSQNSVRKNVFENASQKAMEVFDCEGVIESLYDDTKQTRRLNATKFNLIEHNQFMQTRASTNAWDYNAIQFAGQNGIVRNNLFFNNLGGALGVQVYPDEALYNQHNRIYHNTFYNNHCFGFWGSNDNDPERYFDNIVKNNIFFANLDCAGTAPADIVNQNTTANLLQNNSTDDPLFVLDNENYLSLSAQSNKINAGEFLTQTVGAGSGTNLPVADSFYFSSGNGMQAGDEIQLQNQTTTARVMAIDHQSKTLSLSQSLSWSDAQGVALKFNGVAPDLGAKESP